MNKWWDRRLINGAANDCLKLTKKHDKIIKPQYALERLRAHLEKDQKKNKREAFHVTTEVGQHQMWAAQFLPFDEAQSLDDFRRFGDNGIRPACGHWDTNGTSRRAG